VLGSHQNLLGMAMGSNAAHAKGCSLYITVAVVINVPAQGLMQSGTLAYMRRAVK